MCALTNPDTLVNNKDTALDETLRPALDKGTECGGSIEVYSIEWKYLDDNGAGRGLYIFHEK